MVEVSQVSKRYGPLVALEEISATFYPGEIHAVLGENGAGKSTLVGIMAGFVAPSAGSVTLDGQPIPLGRAFECKRLGIEMIHQHFTLVPNFTVAENLALARLEALAGMAQVSQRARPSLAAAERLGWDVDPQARVRNLAVGQQQRLEILKALGGEALVLFFDEPTAVLSADEVQDLFRVLRQLRDEGRIVVLIAHKLSEVLEIADRVTVLRRGKLIATAPRSEVDAERLAHWMVGEMPTASKRESATQLAPGLEVKDLVVAGDRGERSVDGATFEIRRGEILGVGGVDGNGQVELAEAVAGVRPAESGTVRFEGEPPGRDLGIGFIPQDRHGSGLALGMSVQENLLLGGYRRAELRRGPLLRLDVIREWAHKLIRQFDIRVGRATEPVASLSGGNQQKVVVSRTLANEPALIVAVNPTRGLDFRASEFVHEKLREARDGGAAVLLVSTDLDELLALADRTAFMSRGRLRHGQDATTMLGGAE